MRTVTYIARPGDKETHIKHPDKPMSLCPTIGLETKYFKESNKPLRRTVCPTCSTDNSILDEIFAV